ncbi:MAG: hypothetical protein HYT79_08250 [Elusimicrobia bacterium]|nr:hypothetical protein [Elusimicrobiota bacterium]
MRPIGLLFVALVFIARPSTATEINLLGETGRSSLAAVLNEEEDGDEFSFWRNRFSFAQGDDKAKLRLTAERRQREYVSRTNDFVAGRLELDAWRKSAWAGRTLKWGTGVAFSQKLFRAAAARNWREGGGRFFVEDMNGWEGAVAVKRYDFSNDRDESKLGLTLGRSLEHGPFNFSGRVLSERHWAGERLKFKQEGRASAGWKPGFAHWNNSHVLISGGQRDTKQLAEDRDDNIDFSFWELEWRNSHFIRPDHKVSWALSWKEKDDKDGFFSHRGNSFRAAWDWHPEQRLISRITPRVEWKKMTFQERPLFSYSKTTAGLGLAAPLPDGWRAAGHAALDFYEFPDQQARRRIPSGELILERPLGDNADVSLGTRIRHSLASFTANIGFSF